MIPKELPPLVQIGTTKLTLVKDQYLPDDPQSPIKGVFKHYSVNYWLAIAYLGSERLETVGIGPTQAADAMTTRINLFSNLLKNLVG